MVVQKLSQHTPSSAPVVFPVEPIHNRPIRWFMQSAPWIMLAFLPLIMWPTNPLNIPGQVMFYTGFIAAGLALAAFNIFMAKIPRTFEILVQRGSITGLSTGDDPQDNSQADFELFCQDFKQLLNSQYQWILALLFVVLVMVWYLTANSLATFPQRPILIVGILVEILVGSMIGLVAWRMVAVGVQIWKLPKRFKIHLNILHPDHCGGLEPLGNLCLWNALIISCAGIYLGGWIAIGPNTVFRSEALAYISIFKALLIVPIAMAIISFLFPLWTTHGVMVREKQEKQRQLDELIQKIYLEDQELLELADRLEPEETENRLKRLDTMRKLYSQYQKIPEWPINIQIFSKFAAAQAIPVLSLLGIAEPITNVISGFLQFLANIGS